MIPSSDQYTEPLQEMLMVDDMKYLVYLAIHTRSFISCYNVKEMLFIDICVQSPQ